MAILQTMHSSSMLSNNSKHLLFAVLLPIFRMVSQKEQFNTLPNPRGSNCCKQGQDGQNAYI
ncbi:hypothetical protein ACHAW6_008280 [Cyclotella cf. meneghiniana]